MSSHLNFFVLSDRSNILTRRNNTIIDCLMLSMIIGLLDDSRRRASVACSIAFVDWLKYRIFERKKCFEHIFTRIRGASPVGKGEEIKSRNIWRIFYSKVLPIFLLKIPGIPLRNFRWWWCRVWGNFESFAGDKSAIMMRWIWGFRQNVIKNVGRYFYGISCQVSLAIQFFTDFHFDEMPHEDPATKWINKKKIINTRGERCEKRPKKQAKQGVSAKFHDKTDFGLSSSWDAKKFEIWKHTKIP